MRVRVEDIRAAVIGIAAGAYMHTCYVASLFRYTSQFAKLSPGVQEYVKGIQRLLKAPWNAISYDVVCHLSLLGFPTECVDLRCLTVATRLIISLSSVTRRATHEIRSYVGSMEAARGACTIVHG